MREHALRRAKRISIEDTRAAPGDILAPPRVDGVISLGLWSPAIDRETERGLGDENVAAKRLGRGHDFVVRQLVVARSDPHLAAAGDANLRRPQHMTGRVERYFDTVLPERLAVTNNLIVMSPRRFLRNGAVCSWHR